MGLYSQKSQFEFVGPLSRARGEAQRLPVSAHLPVRTTTWRGIVLRQRGSISRCARAQRTCLNYDNSPAQWDTDVSCRRAVLSHDDLRIRLLIGIRQISRSIQSYLHRGKTAKLKSFQLCSLSTNYLLIDSFIYHLRQRFCLSRNVQLFVIYFSDILFYTTVEYVTVINK